MHATLRQLSAVMLAFLAILPLRADEKKQNGDSKIRVTVLAILATDKNKEVEKELMEIAKEVQKKEPSLTGFKIDRTSTKLMKIGQKEKFPLTEETEVVVILKEEEDHRISITIKPPTVGAISYSCCCGKYFPVITRYQTKDQSRLIIAVMVKPCTTK